MALESATYINQLVATNPTLADPKGQGDDHLRMIKRVLQETFPNFTGAMTATQAQLNAVIDDTLFVKPNMVLMWGGSVATIPTGWKLCNGSGTTSTGLAVPDLRNQFVIGAGSTYAPGNTGGATAHTHTVSVAGTALTIAQMPAHTHSNTYYRSSGANNVALPGRATDTDSFGAIASTSTGGGATHTHTASSGSSSSLPPYYALAYIIKN